MKNTRPSQSFNVKFVQNTVKNELHHPRDKIKDSQLN